MAVPEPKPCPHCGSADTKAFADGSGFCNACGRAFRGTATGPTLLAGEEAETRRTARPRERIKLGLLGVVAGLLGYVAIPAVFLVGASLRREPVSTYVSDVFNRPEGALACGGVSLLVIFAWYAMWAGFHVWRGYPERGVHLMLSGVLLLAASGLAGQGIPSVVGIVGGLLALGPGFLVWRSTREEGTNEAPPEPPTAPEST